MKLYSWERLTDLHLSDDPSGTNAERTETVIDTEVNELKAVEIYVILFQMTRITLNKGLIVGWAGTINGNVQLRWATLSWVY